MNSRPKDLMEIYNLRKLIKIKPLMSIPDKNYSYKKKIKIFGITFRMAGIRHINNPDKIIENEKDLNFGRIFSDDKKSVLIKPRLVFVFEDEYFYTRYFDSYDDAKKACENIMVSPHSSVTLINFEEDYAWFWK